jgi:hypothetical protein
VQMFLVSALALCIVLCLSRCGAWNPTQYQNRVHYLASLNVVTQLFEDVFTAHNISKHRFTIKTFRGEKETFEDGVLRVLVGEEHNVILPGGSHMPSLAVPGQLYSHDGKQRYLVGLEEVYNQCELMCEYSMLNIVNIQRSALFDDNFINKFVYVPALPYEYAPSAGAHTKYPLYTTFGYTNPRGDRRTEVNDDLGNLGHPVVNLHFTNLREYEVICDDAKILVNVHQTYWHHTLEVSVYSVCIQRMPYSLQHPSNSIHPYSLYPYSMHNLSLRLSVSPSHSMHIVICHICIGVSCATRSAAGGHRHTCTHIAYSAYIYYSLYYVYYLYY